MLITRRIDRHLAFLSACAVILFLMTAFSAELMERPVETIGQVAFVAALAALVLVVLSTPRGIWSSSSVYLVVFMLFHFGLVFFFIFGIRADVETVTYLLRWFFSPYTNAAIVLSCIGVVACATGVLAAAFLVGGEGGRNPDDAGSERSLAVFGFLILLGSFAGWFFIVLRTGGTALLFASYSDFLDVTRGSPLPLCYFGMGIGLVFLAAAGRSPLTLIGILAYLAFAVVALPLGLRGEVLFPGLSALVTAGKRTSPLSARKTILLGVALLSIIALLRGVRQTGLGALNTAEIGGNPLSALSELGGSLRPVSEVVLWRDRGEDFAYGASYLAPFDRGLYHFLPDWTRPEVENDERIMNVLIKERVGPIGFSPVAEAFRNFGMPGVVVVMFLIGWVLGRLDVWPVTRIRQAVIGVVFVALLTNIRNDFTPVPFQILAGLTLLGMSAAVRRWLHPPASTGGGGIGTSQEIHGPAGHN